MWKAFTIEFTKYLIISSHFRVWEVNMFGADIEIEREDDVSVALVICLSRSEPPRRDQDPAQGKMQADPGPH